MTMDADCYVSRLMSLPLESANEDVVQIIHAGYF